MDITSCLRPLVLLSVFAAAAVTDAAYHKVYNGLVIAGVFGVTAAWCICPALVERDGLECLVIIIAALLILFHLRLVGGADVKLCMLLAYAYPNNRGFMALAASIVLAAVSSCFIMAYHIMKSGFIGKVRLTVPMGIFIFAGSCLTLL